MNERASLTRAVNSIGTSAPSVQRKETRHLTRSPSTDPLSGTGAPLSGPHEPASVCPDCLKVHAPIVCVPSRSTKLSAHLPEMSMEAARETAGNVRQTMRPSATRVIYYVRRAGPQDLPYQDPAVR